MGPASTHDGPPNAKIKLGRYLVEPDTGRVHLGGRVTKLEPRVMAVLMLFVSRPGEVVSMTALKDELWGSQYVVDEAVKRCVSQIRKAFDDDPREPEIIETLPKRGYRLIAPIGPAPSPRPPEEARLWLRAMAAVAATAAIALGLVSLAGRGESRSALPGTLDMHDVARGQYHRYDREGIESAISLYEHLISQDDQDARALAGLSDALMQKYLRWTPEEDVAARAREAAMRAIELDSASPAPYKALGSFYHFRGQQDLALEMYNEAVRRDPTYWTALNNGAEVLRDAGQYEAARAWFRCALASSPRQLDVLIRLAGVEMRAGQLSQAEEYLESAILLEPENDEVNTMLSQLQNRDWEAMPAVSQCLDETTLNDPRLPCDLVREIATCNAA